jgi:acyl-CoA dehydrogenase
VTTTIDFDVSVSNEVDETRDTVHRFAEEVLRPIGRRLDKMADANEVIAPDSPLWEVFKRYRALELPDLSEAQPPISLEAARLRSVISEELGWGDSGLAISLGVSGFPKMLATLSGNQELMERFANDQVIGCWPITEPDHGSDLILMGGHPQQISGRLNCVARRQGSDYVISGQKSAWVSNGTIATAAALFCAVADADGGICGLGAFLVPLDGSGVRRGPPLQKLGQRSLNQGEIFFDDVRIPAHYMVLPPELGPLTVDSVLTAANGGMGATFVGVARAALEAAIDYARERIQGGTAIIEHQSVRSRLFKMYRLTQAARALSRHEVLYNGTTQPPSLPLAIASKVTATETAFEVANMALQLFGANGLTLEYPIEKLLRDARASMIEDGCNEVLGILGGGRL